MTRHDPDRLEHAVRGAIDELANLLREVRERVLETPPELIYVEAEILLRVQRFKNDLLNLRDMLR
ncbi:hypothetical protein BH11PLA2_BH11PLA2_45900 [soil metagenome]